MKYTEIHGAKTDNIKREKNQFIMLIETSGLSSAINLSKKLDIKSERVKDFNRQLT
jgi:hypothetical protein